MQRAAGKVIVDHPTWGEVTIFVEQHLSIPHQWDCEVDDFGDRFDIDANSLRHAIEILKEMNNPTTKEQDHV